MKLGAKLAIAFTFGLLIIGAVGVQSYLGIERVTETNHWVMHSHEVLEDLEHVLSVLQDAETGQRGYILTGEDHYLAPYNAAAGEIQKDIDQVASLTADEPQQQESIGQLRALANDKLDELRETIAQRKQNGLEAALPVIRSDRGQRDMDQIRGIIDQMVARERGLLEARNTAAGEVSKRSTLMAGLGVLLSLVIMGGAAVIVIRTARLSEGGPLSESKGGRWRRMALRYAAAVAMVGLATAARGWLERHVGPMPLFVTWYPAVLLVATIAGGGPGAVATLLSVLAADYWFIEPIGSFGIFAANDAVATGIFAGTGLFVSLLAERLRRSRYAEAVSATRERELALLNMGNLMVLDLDHRIVRWSEGNRRLYGFDEQEAAGQRTYEFLQTHFARDWEQVHAELLEKGHWEGEATRRGKDGTQLSLSLLWALRRDERGRPEAILEVSTDITPQKAAEDALRQQSEELAGQNEELSRQSEELTQQSEDLSEQNEELQSQSEEIQTLNTDLVHREKTLQTLLDSARLPLGERDAIGTICQAALEMIGPAALGAVVCQRQGEELRILAHAGFGDAAVPACWPVKDSFNEMVMREDRTASLEDASLRPDLNILTVPGHPRFAAALSSPLRVGGRCIGAVSIFSNAPQRWTVEQFGLIEWLSGQCSNALEAMRQAEALRQSQALLQALIDNCQALIYVKDMEGRILIANRPLGEAVGVSVPNLLSKTSREFIGNPEDAQVHMANDRRVIDTGQAITAEESSGGHVFLSVKFPLRDAAGRIFATGGVSTDITDRKRIEAALAESRERLELALRSARMATFDWDIVANKRIWSQDVHRLLGTSPETFTGSAEEFFQVIHPDDRSTVQAALAKALETAAPYETEYRAVWPDGSVRHIAARGTIHHDEAGRPVEMTGICWDISESKQAEEALRQTVTELQRSNKELEQFAYVSAHDLQEPLRQVRSYVGLLKDRYGDRFEGKPLQYFEFVSDGASRMSDLVQGLLEYSRAGTRTTLPRPVASQAALDAALANLAAGIAESHAQITHDALPTVTAEPTRLAQLFQNLIGNAVKFRREGAEPAIHVGCRREGEHWLFSVKDNGIGIEPQYQDKIFMIFQRLHGREKYAGTGIGLAICKKIVEQHGGKIWVESAAGEGSTFYFTLPEGTIA